MFNIQVKTYEVNGIVYMRKNSAITAVVEALGLSQAKAKELVDELEFCKIKGYGNTRFVAVEDVDAIVNPAPSVEEHEPEEKAEEVVAEETKKVVLCLPAPKKPKPPMKLKRGMFKHISTLEELDKAFRNCAKYFHPDKFGTQKQWEFLLKQREAGVRLLTNKFD